MILFYHIITFGFSYIHKHMLKKNQIEKIIFNICSMNILGGCPLIQLKSIADYIEETYHGSITTNSNLDGLVHTAELIGVETIYDSDILYICLQPDELGKSLPMPPDDCPCYTISDHPLPEPFKTLCFTKLPEPLALYKDLRTLLKEENIIYQQTQQLYTALYHGTGLADVIKIAENLLSYPVTVCDASYTFIQRSPMMDDFPYGLAGDRQYGYLDDKEIESLRRNHFESMIYESTSAFYIQSPDYPDNWWIFCPIRIQNVMVGHVAVCVDRIPSQRSLRLTTVLADICAIEMQKHDFFVTRTGMKYENFLIDLLEGHFHDVNMISARLELLNRRFCKFFCIIILKCLEPHDSDLFNKRQISNLRHHYPNSMSVVYKDSIVLFLNQDTPISLDEDFTAKLKEFARLNHMHASISQPFTDILKIQAFYIQAQNALALGEAAAPNEHLHYAHQMFPHYLFQNCDYVQLETGIHHHIHHLQGYDQEFHTEFILTLRTFLDCDRNAAKAAEALHIHRSTFFYRIKKIEEILDVSLTDSKLLFLYELSFMVWDYLCQ